MEGLNDRTMLPILFMVRLPWLLDFLSSHFRMFVGLAINTAHELAQLIPLELLELNEVSIPFPKKKKKKLG